MKKVTYTLILLSVLFTALFADATTDSLRSAIRRYKGLPRIDAQLELAYHLRRSDFQSCREHALNAVREARELCKPDREAKGLYYLGLTYYYNDIVDTSMEYLQEAEQLYRSDRNYRDLAKVLSMIGTTYLTTTGDQEKAISYYNEALIHARKYSDHMTMAVVYSQLSNIFRLNGAYQQAIEFIYNSREQYEKADFTEGVAWINYSIARIYTTMSLYDEADELFLKGYEIYSQLPEDISTLTGQAICLDELAFVHTEMRDLEKAREYNDRAYAIYKRIDNLFGQSNSLKYKAYIQYYSGDSKAALETLERALKLKKEIPDLLGFPGVYHLFGMILRKEGKFRQAIDSLHTGLEYALNNNQKNRIMDLNHQLSLIYVELGQYEKAYDYQCRHVALMDSIYKSKATRGMTQLEALYTLNARQREIDELQQDKLISELRLRREKTVRNLLLAMLVIIVVFTLIVLKLYINNKKTNIALEKNRRKLQELNATKDKFFSIIAHDLKSPFNSIIGFSTMLERYCRAKDYEKIEEFSGNIRDVSKQTFNLLENLLDWSRSQTGSIPFNPRNVDIRVAVQNAAELMYSRAKHKDIGFDIHAQEVKVWADENMLHTVLHNILSNAVKYSGRGSQIHISAGKKEGMLEIVIRDEGIGMDEKTRENIFRIDQSGSRPGTEGEQGTGLGLIISREFIEKHGGSIRVESEPGKGSTFVITIPLT